MKDKIQHWITNSRFIGYSIIGVSGVILDILSYTLFVKAGVPPVVASLVSTTIGITNNFLLNSFFNFKKRDRMLVRFVKFYSVGLIGIFLTAVIIYILHDMLGVGPLISKLVTIPPIVVIQFLLNRSISFSDKSIRRYLFSVATSEKNLIKTKLVFGNKLAIEKSRTKIVFNKVNEISRNKVVITITLSLVVLVGVLLRFYAMTRGHNFDFESYKIVGDIVVNGGNVYAETFRYNYGPIWFSILGFFYWIGSLFASHELIFRILIVALLTSVDLGIAIILKKKYGTLAFVLFFLNPISIIISGYHNQFDNVALFIGMLGVLLYPKDDKKFSKSHMYSAVVIGLSLMTKHIFFILPIWFFLRAKSLKVKLVMLTVPIVMFLASFLPFVAEGFSGIKQNVFMYKSFANAPLLNLVFSDQIVNFINPTFVLIATLIAAGFLTRKIPVFVSMLWYTLLLVVVSPAIANQYLVIAMPAAVAFGIVWFTPYIYSSMALLMVSSYEGVYSSKLAVLFPKKLLDTVSATPDLTHYNIIIGFLFFGTLIYIIYTYEKSLLVRGFKWVKSEVLFQIKSLRT